MMIVTRSVIAAAVIVGTVFFIGLSFACLYGLAGHSRPFVLAGVGDVGDPAIGRGIGYGPSVISRLKEEIGAGLNTGIIRAIAHRRGSMAAGLFRREYVPLHLQRFENDAIGTPSAWVCFSTR